MNEALADYAKQYSFLRYTVPVGAKGQQVTPTATPMTMWASIQSMRDFELLALPELFRSQDGIKIYADRAMQMGDDSKGLYGDRILYHGYYYEVKMVADWQDNDLVHFRYKAFKIQQNRSAA